MPRQFRSLVERFGRTRTSFPPPQPDGSVAIIGDIHGAADLMVSLMIRLLKDKVETLVFVGDYIDRGRNCKEVLAILQHFQKRHKGIRCLAGNHEYMLLAFLDDPVAAGTKWLRHGGLQTLVSFGIRALPQEDNPQEFEDTRDLLRQAMGAQTELWLRGLPLSWSSGNLVVAHAGADPRCGLQEQAPEDHLWGHPDFLHKTRQDGIWVAHGHWIQSQPTVKAGRIAVDTGAYATGALTAAVIRDREITFVTETEERG